MAERAFIPPWERRKQLPEAKPRATKEGGATPYQLGKRFEQAVRGRLQRRGWFVMRAHASKGKVDLLCVHAGFPVWMVQCKRRGEIGSEEWNALFDLAQKHGCWAILATKLSEQTVAYYRLDERRKPRGRGRPWTMVSPDDCRELLPPPQLF